LALTWLVTLLDVWLSYLYQIPTFCHVIKSMTVREQIIVMETLAILAPLRDFGWRKPPDSDRWSTDGGDCDVPPLSKDG
jgi:hypothetical protein